MQLMMILIKVSVICDESMVKLYVALTALLHDVACGFCFNNIWHELFGVRKFLLSDPDKQ